MNEAAAELLGEFPEPLRRVAEAELEAGNSMCEAWRNFGEVILLCRPFLMPAEPGPALLYVEINDPHYWKAEYRLVEEASPYALACRFEPQPERERCAFCREPFRLRVPVRLWKQCEAGCEVVDIRLADGAIVESVFVNPNLEIEGRVVGGQTGVEPLRMRGTSAVVAIRESRRAIWQLGRRRWLTLDDV